MTETSLPSGEPQKEESAPLNELPASDRRRILMGVVAGGLIFLGILLAVIVLASTSSGPKPGPTPKPPVKKNVTNNPFVVESQNELDDRTWQVFLFNNRTAIEREEPHFPTAPIPIVKNTTENFEPEHLLVVFKSLDEHLLNVKYIDPNRERWQVPDYGHARDPYAHISSAIKGPPDYNIIANKDKKFEWAARGKNITGPPLITTETCRLQYFDKYIEFEARIQTDYCFGMGERVETFRLKNDNYSLWNRDYSYDVGGDTEIGTFGSHPFILNRLADKKNFIGLFMRNSNGMVFSMWHTLNSGTFINYKIIGGIIDLYLIHQADAEYILRKYHSIIGRPYLPPVWGMGFQQARKGYTIHDFEQIIKNHQEHRMPIDALWADTELNIDYKTFTVSTDRFNGIKELVQKMHDPHEGIDMRFVAIANPGLKKEVGYKYYDEAIKAQNLILSAYVHNSPYEGRTLAGTTVWLDFFLRSAIRLWAEGMNDLHELTSLDGVWISDNEISNLCDGECQHRSGQKGAGIPDPYHNYTEFDYLFFRPTLVHLERSTLPMAAYHEGDTIYQKQFQKQFYTHNLFGLQSAMASYDSLSGLFEDRRFLVASRSSWPGSGQFSSHWLAENYATWDSLQASIAGVLNFNMFGIPHVGAPIGGFYGNASDELLVRWFELACYYPLMLSYSNSNTQPKEAYSRPAVLEAIKTALVERYSLLRFMYSKMFEAFLWGGPVIHPLFFDFPEDEECYKADVTEKGFMWAKTLYVVPALIPGQRRTRAYLPNWRWYDLRTLEMLTDYKQGHSGDYFYFEQPLGTITVLIKAGSIIPYQSRTREDKIMNVEDLKKIPARIIVAPDHTERASGSMVVDADGVRPHPSPNSHTYRHYAFTYMNHIFRINKLAGFDFHEEHEFDYFWELIILDVFGQHHIDFVCMMDTNLNKKELQFAHAIGSNALLIHDERLAKLPMFNLESIVWGTLDNHDFCRFEIVATSFSYTDQDKTLLAQLVTRDPAAYQMRFDLAASILTDRIISLQVILNEPGKSQWIVPDVVEDVIRKQFHTDKTIHQSGFRTSPLNVPFAFEVASPEDPRDYIFTTRYMPFVYVRNFIHLKFMVNSRHIFGLGERISKFELGDGLYSLWNYDAALEETGLPPGNNMYGSHAFYLIQLQNPREFAGVFFLTSNPLDVKIRHVGMQTQIDHVLSGGIVDAFFMQRGTANDVLTDYHYLIGRPIPLPFWAFGYHQSRWGYKDIEHLKYVIEELERNQIPFDAIWMDKDYMSKFKSFTIDERNWHGITQLVEDLHKKGKQFVALIDASIARDPSFDVYVDGLQRGVFLKSSNPDIPLVGVTWPGYSVWVDFLHPAAVSFYDDQLLNFHNKIAFDGLWLDMNEPSNFCDGDCPDETHYTYYHFPLDFYDDLYYNPTHRALEKGTVSMEALHYGNNQPEFNYHNLFPLLQARATARFFVRHLNQRPFVISSGSFPGVGRYASHWLGDNYSSWHYMQYSIAGMLNFQLFGIPFVGADICGFSGNGTSNLCSRWMQLGAFYPLMRNHNSPEGHPQEPFVDPQLAKVSRVAIHRRYSLARYIYSEYMHTALRGGIIIKPVMFEFPDDKDTYSIMDTTFMFGSAIRVTPVLEDDVTKLVSYFPNHDWFEFPSFKKVLAYNHTATRGKDLELECSLESANLNLHIKAGVIFSYQDQAMDLNIMSITQIREHPIKLIVVPDHNGIARGNIYYDNEDPIDFRDTHHDYNLEAYHNVVKIQLVSGSAEFKYTRPDQNINQIVVLNAQPYFDTQCAKVHDKVQKADHYLKPRFANDILTLDPNGDYTISFSNIDSISWYNTTTC